MTEQKQDIAELIQAKRQEAHRLFSEAVELECAEQVQAYKDAVAAYAERVATSGVSEDEARGLARLRVLRSDLEYEMIAARFGKRDDS